MTFPRPIGRRAVLAAGAAATFIAASPALARERKGFLSRKRLPVGVQLYTLADAAKADLGATFARIAATGFRTVELAGYHGQTPAALRTAADNAGLALTSIHLPAAPRGADPGLAGDVTALAADLQRMGITVVALPIFPIPDRIAAKPAAEGYLDYIRRVAALLTIDDWKRTAAFLNDRGAALQRAGLRLSYHNHNPEFRPLAGGDVTGFDILMKETDHSLVGFEMDAGWVAAAGVDPVALLKRHPGRFTMMHVKDIQSTTAANFAIAQNPTQVGDGSIDWPKLLPAAFAGGVRKFFVEQEPPFTIDRVDALRRSFIYLKTAG